MILTFLRPVPSAAAPGDRSGPCLRCRCGCGTAPRRPRYGEASRLVTCACSGGVLVVAGGRDVVEQDRRTAARGSSASGHLAVGGLRQCRRGRPSAGGVDDREVEDRSARRPRRRGRRPGPGAGRRSRRRPRRSGRPERSVLLTTRMTGSFAASALRSTKRVCGSGPSDASTSSTTPSTIDRPRSTSPPKSAWPGVSMTLMTTSVPSGRVRCTGGVLREDGDALLAFEVARSP